jgi:acyl carrier protein
MSEHLEASAGAGDAVPILDDMADSQTLGREGVISILADHLVRRPSELTDDKRLVGDLNFDDIDCIDVALAFEDIFAVDFSGDEVAAAGTVGALVAAVICKGSVSEALASALTASHVRDNP